MTFTDKTIILGDGISEMYNLPEGCASLVLSDLPSGETRAKFDIKPDLFLMWKSIWHVLKDNGIAVLMASSFRFAKELSDSSIYFRYDLIWSKSIATGFLNSKRRPLRSHEFILVFSKEQGIYHPQMVQGATPIHAARRRSHGENYGPMTKSTESRAGATDRYPTSILEFGSVGTTNKKRRHPQQKPEDMLRWLIRTYSDEGDLVVDPFAGSGSAGIAAFSENREFIGWDSDPRFGGISLE